MELEYWLNRRSYLTNEYHNARQLLVLQNKLQLKYNTSLLKADIVNKIKLAYKASQKFKLMAEILSLKYRTQLAMAKEEAGELSGAVFLRNNNHIEAQRRLFRNTRHME